MTRARLCSTVAAFVLSLVTIISVTGSAGAAMAPHSRATLQFNDEQINIDITLHSCGTRDIKDATKIDVMMPLGMTGSVVDMDGGFRHLGYDIDIANRTVATGAVVLRVLVPSRSTCQIEVGYAFVDAMAGGAMAAPGRTNTTVKLSIVI